MALCWELGPQSGPLTVTSGNTITAINYNSGVYFGAALSHVISNGTVSITGTQNGAGGYAAVAIALQQPQPDLNTVSNASLEIIQIH